MVLTWKDRGKVIPRLKFLLGMVLKYKGCCCCLYTRSISKVFDDACYRMIKYRVLEDMFFENG